MGIGRLIWAASVIALSTAATQAVAAPPGPVTVQGDVNGDGVVDQITGAGAGDPPQVRVQDGKTGAVLHLFMAFAPTFLGGVSVAAGDVTGDGKADIIVGAGPGGPPYVKVFDGQTGATLMSFMAFPANYPGGVTVTSQDRNGDGRADIVVQSAPGLGPTPGGSHVKVFSGADGSELASYFTPPPARRRPR